MPDTFVQLPAQLLSRTDLVASDKLIYAVLADRTGRNSACWPGIRRLAADCGLGRNTVLHAIARLEAAGLLEVDRVTGNPAHKTNKYRLVTSPAKERTQDGDVPKTVTHPKRDRGRTQNGTGDVPILETEPYQLNQTNGTRPRKGARDPWSEAVAVMTGNTLKTDRFKAAWHEWGQYRRQARKPLTSATIKRQIRELEGFGHDDAIASIEQSIKNGWAGVFAPRDGRRGGGRAVGRLSRIEAPPGKYDGLDYRPAQTGQTDPAPGSRREAASA